MWTCWQLNLPAKVLYVDMEALEVQQRQLVSSLRRIHNSFRSMMKRMDLLQAVTAAKILRLDMPATGTPTNPGPETASAAACTASVTFVFVGAQASVAADVLCLGTRALEGGSVRLLATPCRCPLAVEDGARDHAAHLAEDILHAMVRIPHCRHDELQSNCQHTGLAASGPRLEAFSLREECFWARACVFQSRCASCSRHLAEQSMPLMRQMHRCSALCCPWACCTQLVCIRLHTHMVPNRFFVFGLWKATHLMRCHLSPAGGISSTCPCKRHVAVPGPRPGRSGGPPGGHCDRIPHAPEQRRQPAHWHTEQQHHQPEHQRSSQRSCQQPRQRCEASGRCPEAGEHGAPAVTATCSQSQPDSPQTARRHCRAATAA